ncbi:MAG: hypothetical protein NC218_09900 [Acetobacter sp.]|nr:hypothetical protein [Acetobacter sp.]
MNKLFSLFVIIYLSGCCYNFGHFTILSNRMIDTQNIKNENIKKQYNIEGRDVGHTIVFMRTKSNPNLNDALNDALKKSQTDLMVDVEVKVWYWFIPYLYSQTGWKVQGTAIKTRNN